MDLIYYHNNCPDGWCAAYIAKTKYPEAELRPLNHYLTDEQINALINEVTGKDAMMIDYSLRTRENNDRMAAAAKSYRLLDHHKSAQASLEGASYAVFDMKRSGAGLAWDYLFGKDSPCPSEIAHGCVNPEAWEGFPRPWFVNHIEDRDLWTWKLPNSHELCAYLDSVPWTVESFDKLKTVNLASVLEFGRGAVSHLNEYVKRTLEDARDGYILGHKAKILNAPYSGCSELGMHLANQAGGVGMTWFERKDNVISFSLRGDGSVDVSTIALQFGGGSHKNAAGFQLPYEKGRQLLDLAFSRGEHALGNTTN